MNNFITEIKNINRPDKLGIISAISIIISSSFGSQEIQLLKFLFGISILCLSLSFSFNSEVKEKLNTNQIIQQQT